MINRTVLSIVFLLIILVLIAISCVGVLVLGFPQPWSYEKYELSDAYTGVLSGAFDCSCDPAQGSVCESLFTIYVQGSGETQYSGAPPYLLGIQGYRLASHSFDSWRVSQVQILDENGGSILPDTLSMKYTLPASSVSFEVSGKTVVFMGKWESLREIDISVVDHPNITITVNVELLDADKGVMGTLEIESSFVGRTDKGLFIPLGA